MQSRLEAAVAVAVVVAAAAAVVVVAVVVVAAAAHFNHVTAMPVCNVCAQSVGLVVCVITCSSWL